MRLNVYVQDHVSHKQGCWKVLSSGYAEHLLQLQANQRRAYTTTHDPSSAFWDKRGQSVAHEQIGKRASGSKCLIHKEILKKMFESGASAWGSLL